jgi:hypothetical protein
MVPRKSLNFFSGPAPSGEIDLAKPLLSNPAAKAPEGPLRSPDRHDTCSDQRVCLHNYAAADPHLALSPLPERVWNLRATSAANYCRCP